MIKLLKKKPQVKVSSSAKTSFRPLTGILFSNNPMDKFFPKELEVGFRPLTGILFSNM